MHVYVFVCAPAYVRACLLKLGPLICLVKCPIQPVSGVNVHFKFRRFKYGLYIGLYVKW